MKHYDFILQVFHITRDFGREYKYTLGQDMKKEAISLQSVIFGLDPNIQKSIIDSL